MCQVFGWEMPSSYTSPAEEHEAVRTAVGFIDLSYFGSLRIWGTEGAQFLHGLVTNDVKGLKKGQGMRAAFLTGHGKVRALCRVLGLGDGEYLVINDPQTHEQIKQYVAPFSYAGDFKVEDVSDQRRVLSVQGPSSLLVMREVSFEPVPKLAPHEWMSTIIAGHHVVVVGTRLTGELGFDILVPAEGLKDVWDFVLVKGGFHSIRPFGHRALDSLKIEAGVPVYGIDVDDTNMMLETDLADAVSFTKGCYTGQEAVAMATYRGHISKRLSGLRIQGEVIPARGDKVFKDGKEIGYITSALKSPTLRSVIAMAYIKYGFYEPENPVDVLSEGISLRAVVAKLPFYRGAHSD